jgi:hypothetical protein
MIDPAERAPDRHPCDGVRVNRHAGHACRLCAAAAVRLLRTRAPRICATASICAETARLQRLRIRSHNRPAARQRRHPHMRAADLCTPTSHYTSPVVPPIVYARPCPPTRERLFGRCEKSRLGADQVLSRVQPRREAIRVMVADSTLFAATASSHPAIQRARGDQKRALCACFGDKQQWLDQPTTSTWTWKNPWVKCPKVEMVAITHHRPDVRTEGSLRLGTE